MSSADNSNSTPLISAIMPFYDNIFYAREAIESIAAQTFQDWELVLISDGASLEAQETMLKYAEELCPGKYQFFSYPTRKGPNYARNYGIQRARGSIFAVTDSDDISYPERFAEAAKLFLEEDVDVVYSDFHKFIESRSETLLCKARPSLSRNIMSSGVGGVVPHSTILCRMSLARDYPYPAYINSRGGDTLFLQMLYLFGSQKWRYIPKPLVKSRLHSRSFWGQFRQKCGITDQCSYPGAAEKIRMFSRWLRYLESIREDFDQDKD